MQSGKITSAHLQRRLRGRAARTRSIGTKLTPDEERKIVAAAEEDGKAPGEWAREILLRAAIHRNSEEMERYIIHRTRKASDAADEHTGTCSLW